MYVISLSRQEYNAFAALFWNFSKSIIPITEMDSSKKPQNNEITTLFNNQTNYKRRNLND